MIRRREFITLLGGAATMWPLASGAQQAGRTYRLGVLHNQGPQSPQYPAFYDELRRLGFVEGQNLIVDSRGYALRTEQFPTVAAELVKSRCYRGWRSRRRTGGAGSHTHHSDLHFD